MILPAALAADPEPKEIGKPAETGPLILHLLTPSTVRLPAVALDAKSMVTELLLPFMVAPVPEYDQVYVTALSIIGQEKATPV